MILKEFTVFNELEFHSMADFIGPSKFMLRTQIKNINIILSVHNNILSLFKVFSVSVTLGCLGRKSFNVAFVLAVTLFKYNTKFSTYSAVCRFFNSLFNLKMLLHFGVVTELSLAYLISKYIRLFFSCSSIALKKDVILFPTYLKYEV